LNLFGKIIINTGKLPIECRNSFIALPFQGIEFCKFYIQRFLLTPKL